MGPAGPQLRGGGGAGEAAPLKQKICSLKPTTGKNIGMLYIVRLLINDLN